MPSARSPENTVRVPATGATRWQTISRVIVPAALSGIAAAIILGIGRAIGETMAVIMVTGNAAIIPSPIWDVLSSVRTLTGTLGIEMGDVAVGSEHYHALFGVALVLLIITLIINMSAVAILNHLRDGSSQAKRNGHGSISRPSPRLKIHSSPIPGSQSLPLLHSCSSPSASGR